eukprot:m.25137 g.25137  ORF g.25137 m.25137 type:complete len:475 (+) comp13140_c0_seq2:162-1586(+)
MLWSGFIRSILQYFQHFFFFATMPTIEDELAKYKTFDEYKFTGTDSEWTGTAKPGYLRRVILKSGFNWMFRSGVKKENRLLARQTGVSNATNDKKAYADSAAYVPSSECKALNKLFRKGRGRQYKIVSKVRQTFIGIVCAPEKNFVSEKLTDPVDRRFDCWEVPGLERARAARQLTKVPKGVHVFYVHGGGFIGGDWAGFRGFCQKLHHEYNNAPIFFPNYRMAPEVSVVDQVEDCLAAYKYFLHRYDLEYAASPENEASRVVVMGDSCGGAIGMLLLQAIERERQAMSGVKLRAPDGAVFFSAVTDLGCTGASHNIMGAHYMDDAHVDGATVGETVFDPEVIKWCFEIALLGGRSSYAATDPRVSPVHGECRGLPPVYMMAAAAEVFADDTRRMCAKLDEAGVTTVMDVWEALPGGVFHAWPVFWKYCPEGEAAIAKAHAWIQELPQFTGASRTAVPATADGIVKEIVCNTAI